MGGSTQEEGNGRGRFEAACQNGRGAKEGKKKGNKLKRANVERKVRAHRSREKPRAKPWADRTQKRNKPTSGGGESKENSILRE